MRSLLLFAVMILVGLIAAPFLPLIPRDDSLE